MNDEPYQIGMDKLLTPEEVRVLLAACARRARLDLANGRKVWVVRHLLVHLACASGLRTGELARLRVGDLLQDEGPALLAGRSPHARRVRLGPPLTRHIEDYLGIRQQAWGERLDDGDLMLPGRQGRPYTAAALGFSFHKAAEAAGLSGDYTLRNARHSYSAFLLARTGDLRYVQRQMGHASASMTLLYRDVAPLVDRRLAEALIWS